MSNGTDAVGDRGTSVQQRGTSKDPHLAPVCTISITSSLAERSFRGSETGTATFTARLSGTQPAGSTVKWDVLPPGPTYPEKRETGTIAFEKPASLRTRGYARHPNRARVRVSVQKEQAVICKDVQLVSVPQFFQIQLVGPDKPVPAEDPIPGPERFGFDTDLERLGLQRRPFPPLTREQDTTNFEVRRAVLKQMYSTLASAFADVNVVFTEADPGDLVGRRNVSTVAIGGILDLSDTAYGSTAAPREDLNPKKRDEDNLDPAQVTVIQSGWFTAAGEANVTKDPIYKNIFDGLAIEDHRGKPLLGQAVDAGEYQLFPRTPRQRTVSAAIRAFGTFLGTATAHECGHALGLDHNRDPNNPFRTAPLGELMDEGRFLTFRDLTGITSFDPTTGALRAGAPVKFGERNLKILRRLLPILRMGPPAP